ncbi:MAG: hypothetical protein JWO77_1123 [Ilumatobacteraceae bacterium]|nr:hypothetical protein [Ilumatobacteraceae bacterium]
MGDPPVERRPPRLRLEVAVPVRDAWVVELVVEICRERGWTVDDRSTRAEAVAIIGPVGAAIAPVDEPALVITVEQGTPRSPVVQESAPHLVARTELVIGAFKARRNQRITREAIGRFLERAEQDRPSATEPLVAGDPAEAAPRSGAEAVIEENRALLAAVDAWLARTTLTPEAARAIHADRAIVDAAIGAPVIDLVIIDRAASRLAAVIDP